jgi:hypothetical protein
MNAPSEQYPQWSPDPETRRAVLKALAEKCSLDEMQKEHEGVKLAQAPDLQQTDEQAYAAFLKRRARSGHFTSSPSRVQGDDRRRQVIGAGRRTPCNLTSAR